MQFTPKSADEIAADGLMPAGVYDFEVESATEAQSKAGNDMMVVKLAVFDDEGKRRLITDYLLEVIAYKLRHAAECVGALDQYENGTLSPADFDGKSGRVKIKITPAKGDYPAKNEVADYVVAEPSHAPVRERPAPARAPAMASDDPFDDIPF